MRRLTELLNSLQVSELNRSTVQPGGTTGESSNRGSGVNPGGLGIVTPQILVVEGVVSGLLRSKGEGREPRTPQFSNQIDATESRCHGQLYSVPDPSGRCYEIVSHCPVKMPTKTRISMAIVFASFRSGYDSPGRSRACLNKSLINR
jgi:hypothetical protein